ncbi:MAG: dTDP-4-amino-4,6-dideoxygalactose transaminase [Candidatus Omnitrophica bacterium]|nr:dTDP-4-amino-4,6-dideoxygalactose transaminase [Candidatus Omnitrophota bacterium]MCM8790578.1 dTDP-4-amino-4,6-dideoxygalactose transaminase [Candidatus Omnitrophota bacterium]
MIHYSVPFIGKEEEAAAAAAIANKKIQGEGVICKEAEAVLSRVLGGAFAYLVTSGTHALELSLMALEIGRGDEVICPSFTFVSTANAILRQGARPVFCEIEDRTLNIDIDDAMRRVTKKTRAIIPVHYGGLSCDMERLIREASRKNIHVIEDAAQAIGAMFNGRPLGTFGDLGCLSFHSTKNITCGEGGALVVNKRSLCEAVQIGREKGTNRFLFLEGKIDKYTWIDVGSSFVISDVLAAVLLGQLKKIDFITERRRVICSRYADAFEDIAKEGYIKIPQPDKRSTGNGHIFWALLDKGISRKDFIEDMKKAQVECTHHYVPLHSSPFATKHLGYRKEDLPVTEDIAARLVRFPVHPLMSDSDTDKVIRAAKSLFGKEAVCRRR